jgi:hypothetical protein
MKAKKLVEKVAVVPSESKGIGAAIAKLIRRRVLSISLSVSRGNTHCKEEREIGSAVAVRSAPVPLARGLR